jgi:predicted alpha/beta hydrolase
MCTYLYPTNISTSGKWFAVFKVRLWELKYDCYRICTTYMFCFYSWHEMGVYDLPAMIDHVLAVSKKPSLYYMGHSMGSTMFFVLTSSLPHYNSKIRVMFGFAPAAFNSHMKNDLFRIAQFSRVGVSSGRLFGYQFV